MLIKEYRIPLPMTVEEYRIAQLYMIAKKSREESQGKDSGVEILVNEPYSNGPGGDGQFTHKIYHVGPHLPGWFKSLLPKSAMVVEEEAWNSYPYTKTRYKCPFVEKFSLEVETYYTPDGGHLDNVFKLDESEKRSRIVDLIDVVRDHDGTAYEFPEKEDPTVYVSGKTGRGPLGENWIAEHWEDCRGKAQPTPNGNSIMCAYKLCKVEFRYWGMQSKIERFIHDMALRRTMMKGHLQAWLWQDEWFGLTMEDIRTIEKETAEILKKRMHGEEEEEELGAGDDGGYERGFEVDPADGRQREVMPSVESVEAAQERSPSEMKHSSMRATFNSIEYSDADVLNIIHKGTEASAEPPPGMKKSRSAGLRPPHGFSGRKSSRGNVDEDEDDEFFDCCDHFDDTSSLAKWSSMELGLDEDSEGAKEPQAVVKEEQIQVRRVQSLYEKSSAPQALPGGVGPPHSAAPTLSFCAPSFEAASLHQSDICCPTTVLILVVHGGSVLDTNLEASVRKSDVTTFRGAFESIMRTHYPSLVGHVVVKCVPTPGICTEGLEVLSSLSPYSFDVSSGDGVQPVVSHDHLPIGAIPLYATSSPDYAGHVDEMVQRANKVYADFLSCGDGLGFCGQVCLVGDSVGAVLAYDALCRSVKRSSSESSVADPEKEVVVRVDGSCSDSTHISEQQPLQSFDFDVMDFFVFGSPLANVLAYRKIHQTDQRHPASSKPSKLHDGDGGKSVPCRPAVQQLYNLFHPSDPISCRLEPLMCAKFSRVPPVNVPRYQKYPMGDGGCLSLIEFVQGNVSLFVEGQAKAATASRRLSEESVGSGVFDTQQQLQLIEALRPKWWGGRRIDYALYCPEGLANFPTNSLPHLFHSSYWESADAISFILRQLSGGSVAGGDRGRVGSRGSIVGIGRYHRTDLHAFTPKQPREKWIKKRTSVKIRNGSANHRGNDVLVTEGSPQVVCGRFSYGPLDMAALTGEKVDVHVMKDPPAGEWIRVSTEVTDKHGRVAVELPEEHAMGFGIYPVQMLVRGDHTTLHVHLAVVPPRTETVVFSIDGSFAASVSVTGRDPKVKPGAVDVVRHWQELGYLILYVTGRPDMQLLRVVSWLSQHNFPHGLVFFADGFTTDPLRHKGDLLRSLVVDQKLIVHKAYGSSKDVGVYSSLGLGTDDVYVVGKAPGRRHASASTFLAEGYADHLAQLTAHGGSRPARGNARMVIPKATFGLPGQTPGLQLTRRRTVRHAAAGAAAKRTTSYPLNNGGGGSVKENRGTLPRADRGFSSFLPRTTRGRRTSWGPATREPQPQLFLSRTLSSRDDDADDDAFERACNAGGCDLFYALGPGHRQH